MQGVTVDWLSVKSLVATVGLLCVFSFLWSIYELEEYLRPDEPATWTKIISLLLVLPAIYLAWWGFR